MSKVTIYVSREGQTSQLHLRDSEGHSGTGNIITDVRAGDTVKWVITEGIDEITGIHPKNGSQNIFSSGPIKNEDGSWMGTVGKSASGRELYSIDYTIGGMALRDDPELDVKPPTD